MVMLQINSQKQPLQGSNLYTGWFLTFEIDESLLEGELGITPAMTALGAVPRLMLVRLGDKGAFKVSPTTGKVLGFELFGVRLMNNEILSAPTPEAERGASLVIPLTLPYHPVIFEQGTGEVTCLEPGFRHIGYKVAASRSGNRFRVQLFRAGPVDQYVRIANCLIAGFDEVSTLSEIWLVDVEQPTIPHLPLR